MTIGMAQQRGIYVYLYDEKNHQLCMVNGELHGYTANTVTVKRGSCLYMYDEKGHLIGSRNC